MRFVHYVLALAGFVRQSCTCACMRMHAETFMMKQVTMDQLASLSLEESVLRSRVRCLATVAWSSTSNHLFQRGVHAVMMWLCLTGGHSAHKEPCLSFRARMQNRRNQWMDGKS